jgi:hypothetical protein
LLLSFWLAIGNEDELANRMAMFDGNKMFQATLTPILSQFDVHSNYLLIKIKKKLLKRIRS